MSEIVFRHKLLIHSEQRLEHGIASLDSQSGLRGASELVLRRVWSFFFVMGD